MVKDHLSKSSIQSINSEQILLVFSQYLHIDVSYFLKGGAWLSVSFIVSTISSLALGLVLANLLPKTVYGQYNYILTIFSLLSLTALPGINTALIQSIAKGYEGTIPNAFRAQIRWSLLGTILSLAGAFLYFFFLHDTTVALALTLIAVFIPLTRPLTIYAYILRGKKHFRLDAITFSIAQITLTVVLIMTAFLIPQVLPLFAAYCLVSLIVDASFLYKIYINGIWNQKKDNSLIGYGKHLTVINLLSTISASIDRLIIFNLLGPVSLAIYSLAISPPEQINALLGIGDALSLPRLTEQDPDVIRRQMSYHIFKLFLICTFIVAAYILAAPYIYRILFPRYLDSVVYSQIFSLSLISLCFFPAATFLQAKKRLSEQYQTNIFYAVSQIFFITLFWWHWHLLGVIIARVLTRLLTGFFTVVLFYRSKS